MVAPVSWDGGGVEAGRGWGPSPMLSGPALHWAALASPAWERPAILAVVADPLGFPVVLGSPGKAARPGVSCLCRGLTRSLLTAVPAGRRPAHV